MNLDQELQALLAQRAEEAHPPVPDIEALRSGGLARRRRRRTVVVSLPALVVLVILVVGLAWAPDRSVHHGVDQEPAGEPSAWPYVGRWTSTDVDGSHQTMRLRADSGGHYAMVLHDDFTGPCNGPSTDSGTGGLVWVKLVISGITTACANGSNPVGAARSLTFVHRPFTEDLTDNDGVVWSPAPASGHDSSSTQASATLFVGRWASRDVDGSHQTMTLRASSTGQVVMVLRDDFTGPCNGPSTDSGSGAVEDDQLVISGITTACRNRKRPVGAGDSLTFVHRAGSDTLRDNVGVVWSRE
jgi:hypothetical protein